MNVMLMCAAGMSTSMLVNKLKKYAADNNIDLNIWADTVSNCAQYKTRTSEIDIILLGPQVSYQEKTVHKVLGDACPPVAVIPMQDYGRQNCEAVFKLIDETLGK